MASFAALKRADIQHLHQLCQTGDLVGLQDLVVERRLSLEDIRSHDNEALRLACQHNYLPIIKYFMTQGLKLEDFRSNENVVLRWESTSLLVL